MINFVIQVAVTLIAWLILMFVCTNLIGFIIGGFYTNPELAKIVDGNEILAEDYRKTKKANKLISIFAIIVMILFLTALYNFWNIALLIAALMILVARIPDLIWEMRHGRKLDRSEMSLMPRAYTLLSVISYASVSVVWYSLYRI